MQFVARLIKSWTRSKNYSVLLYVLIFIQPQNSGTYIYCITNCQMVMFTQLPNPGALLLLMYCFHVDLGMMGFKQRHVQESSSLQTSIMFFYVPPKAGQLLGLPTRAFAEAFQQDNVRFGSRQLQVECFEAQSFSRATRGKLSNTKAEAALAGSGVMGQVCSTKCCMPRALPLCDLVFGSFIAAC